MKNSLLLYSLLKQKPELQEFVPENFRSPLNVLQDKSTSRAFEIMREETAQETHRAHTGDLIYIQAWLSAIDFSFKNPISEKEIIAFIIQHCEGLDPEIDKKLVEQKYKSKLGPHQLATIKRRIASLSGFLELENLPNPCRSREVSMLLSKLTKKYGTSKPAGKAITRDILDDILDTCDESLISIRNKAILLFAFSSGGRRRKEVATALFKDLIKHADGDYTYTIPQSKTDQSGQGYVVPIKGRAAKALNDWITKANIVDGNIFRSISKSGIISEYPLAPVDINRAVKKHIKLAGYNEKEFGAHGLRSGFVTEAGRKQKPLGDVMRMTTHRSVATVIKYYQAGDISNNSAANLAD